MWPIAIGLGLLLLGFFGALIVCSRVNDPVPAPQALDTPPGLRQGEAQREIVEVFEV